MIWENKWKISKKIQGGSQGDCFCVKRIKNDIYQNTYFLKIMKSGGSYERRRRFFIETTIGKTLEISKTTNIVDTNVEYFKDKSIDLYYVSEYVDGERLDEYVKLNNLEEDDIIRLFRELLVILKECHTSGIVHRDIKPENIIIKSGSLYLVDFGIASWENKNKNKNKNKNTKVGQEIGNRFLRLPEFSAGSMNKRDVRSDLTLSSAIALYCISKKYPRVLIDETGSYPHQRAEFIESICSYNFKNLWNIIFDKSFSPNLSDRWSSASDLIELVDKMNSKTKTDLDSLKEILQSHKDSIPSNRLSNIKNDLETVYNALYNETKLVIFRNCSSFRTEEQFQVYQLGHLIKTSEVRLYPIAEIKHVSVIIISRLLGDQIIGYLNIDNNETEFCRVSTNVDTSYNPNFGTNIEEAVLRACANFIT